MQIISGAGAYRVPAPGELNDFTVHLDVPDLTVGTFSIPAGGTDDQLPHTEDEIYVVISGRAQFTGGGETAAVGPGDVIFVPAGEGHRFFGIAEDLVALVVFGPRYRSRG